MNKKTIEELNELAVEIEKHPKANLIPTNMTEEELQAFIDMWNVTYGRKGKRKIKLIRQDNGILKLDFP